jgi:hypothetical protein
VPPSMCTGKRLTHHDQHRAGKARRSTSATSVGREVGRGLGERSELGFARRLRGPLNKITKAFHKKY